MLDLIIYFILLAGLGWVGWDDRNQPFDREHAVPLTQEEGTSGSRN